MRNLTKLNMIVSIFFILIGLFVGCSDSTTKPIADNDINIEFPIGKKAIYALETSAVGMNTVGLKSIDIFSLQFDTVFNTPNGVEYIGKVERFSTLISSPDSLFIDTFVYQDSGNIVVSIDEKWVLFQNSKIVESSQIFMKQSSIKIDTTLIPTLSYNQFPVFPKIINPNTQYSVFRPGDNASDSIQYLGVQINFDFSEYIDWSDIFGTDRGIYFTAEQSINKFNWVINKTGIIDSKGIIVSKMTVEIVLPDSVTIDTVRIQSINRRIVNFDEPKNIKKLSWYGEYVKENGLNFVHGE